MSCVHHVSAKNRRASMTDAPYSRHADWWKNPDEQPTEEKVPSKYSHKEIRYRLSRKRKTNWSIFLLSNELQSVTNEARFRYYAAKWKEEIGGDSSSTNITSNMNYLRIIRIGDEAIPLILRELQKESYPWFVALRAISGNDSVGQDSPGDFRKKASAWIQWGKEHGYL